MIMAKSVITDLIEKLSGVQPKQGKKRSIPHNLSIDRPSKVLFIEDQVPAVRISWNLLEYVKQSSEKNDNAISPYKRQGIRSTPFYTPGKLCVGTCHHRYQ